MDLKKADNQLWKLSAGKPSLDGAVKFGALTYGDHGELSLTFNVNLISLVENEKEIVMTCSVPIDLLPSFKAIETLLGDIRGNCRQYFFIYNGTCKIKLGHKEKEFLADTNFSYEDVQKLVSGSNMKVTGRFGYYLNLEKETTGMFFKTTDIRVGRK
jgi:hypothetical protein